MHSLETNDTLTHAQNLSVVAEYGALDAEGVVCSDGADTLDLVGADGDSETSAADEQSTVYLTRCDLLGSLGGDQRVGCKRAREAISEMERAIAKSPSYSLAVDSTAARA